MKTYCLVCKKNTDNIYSKMIKTENNRLMLLSQFSVWEKKSRFISEKEAKGSGILSSLGVKTLLSNILGLNVLF